MLRAALRSLAAHRLRLFLTALAIVLGVSFVAGTLVFTDSLQKSFTTLVDQRTADVQVEPRGPAGGTQGGPPIADTPRSLPATDVNRVAAIDGVAVAEGYVTTRSAVILGSDGRPLGGQGGASSGRSWVQAAAMNPLSIAEGAPPQNSGDIVLDRSTARRANVVIGDTVTIALPRVVEGKAVASARLVGILDDSLSATFGGGTLAAFTLTDAQRYFLSDDRVSSVRVLAEPGVGQDVLAERISAELGTSVTVTTGQQQTDRATARVEEQLGFLTTFLLVFALIALFVASFLIFNTFTMLVAQRTKELALLRALGASRGQVQRSVLVEALVVGLVASLMGVVAGLGLALLLRALFSVFGAALPGGSLVVTPRTVLVSLGVGVMVTLVCAWFPARRAARVPPVAALRDDVALPQRSLRVRAVVSLVLVTLAVVFAARGMMVAADNSQQAAQLVGLSALLALIAAIASAAFLARPVLALIGWPLRGVVGRLARENGRRNPRRTAATSTALMIGVALMASLSVVASSATASVAAFVDDTVGADFVITGAGFRPFPVDVVEAVRDTPGVSVATPVRQTVAQVGSTSRIPVTGVEPQELSRVLTLSLGTGSLASLGPGEALVDTDTAATLNLVAGDSVNVTLLTGEGSFVVAGIYEPVGLYRGFIVPMGALVPAGSGAPISAVYIGLARDANAEVVGAELNRRLAPFPVVQVQNQAQIKQSVQDQVGSVLGFLFALLALAVIIAVLGIVNTLLLSVAERTREIGLIRAVGAMRGQIRRLVILESVLIALFGALVGVALGVLYGVLLQRALATEGIAVLEVPAVRIITLVVVAAMAGVVAALWPAIRASRLDVLRAISVS